MRTRRKKLNEIIIEGNLATIVIPSKTHGTHYTIIDTKNIDKIKNYTWRISYEKYGSKKIPTVRTRLENRKDISLHRFIIRDPQGLYIDHINGDTLLNTEENLRICTNKQNLENRKSNYNSTSGVRGVYPTRDKWTARIGHNYEIKYIGTFNTIEEAERAVLEARLKYYTHNIGDRTNGC